jgi:hypothetical protein
LKGKKTENIVFIIKSKFNKVKLHQYDKEQCKGLPLNMKETTISMEIQIIRTCSRNIVNELYKFFVTHELLCLLVSTSDFILLWHQHWDI